MLFPRCRKKKTKQNKTKQNKKTFLFQVFFLSSLANVFKPQDSGGNLRFIVFNPDFLEYNRNCFSMALNFS